MNKWEVDEQTIKWNGEKSPLLSAHAGQKLWRDQIKESFVELVGMNGSNFKNEMLFLSFNTAIITTGNGWDIAQNHPFLICIWNFILTRERKRPVSFRYQLLKVPISRLRILDIYNVRTLCRYELQYILPFKNFIFVDFLAVKVNGSDVKPGICVTVNTRSYRHTENI